MIVMSNRAEFNGFFIYIIDREIKRSDPSTRNIVELICHLDFRLLIELRFSISSKDGLTVELLRRRMSKWKRT